MGSTSPTGPGTAQPCKDPVLQSWGKGNRREAERPREAWQRPVSPWLKTRRQQRELGSSVGQKGHDEDRGVVGHRGQSMVAEVQDGLTKSRHGFWCPPREDGDVSPSVPHTAEASCF